MIYIIIVESVILLFVSFKWYKSVPHRSHRKGKKISIDYVKKIVDDFLVNDFYRQIENREKIVGITLRNNGFVEVKKKCINHECPRHVSRADCCYSSYEENGETYCNEIIDLNETVGLEPTEEKYDSKLLTEKEIKILGDVFK